MLINVVSVATTPDGSLSSYRIALNASVTAACVIGGGGSFAYTGSGFSIVAVEIAIVAVAVCSRKFRREGVVADREDVDTVWWYVLLIVLEEDIGVMKLFDT